MLCPGLSKKIQIEFKRVEKSQFGTSHDLNKVKAINSAVENYYDCIKIALDDNKYEIPIRAVK